MNAYLALLIGLAAAGLGGELFVRGTVGLAQAARIAPGIIAATVVAFSTSSPELVVAITSALEGKPAIALGNALGANIVNVAVVLGITALIQPLRGPTGPVRREYMTALVVPIATLLLLADGTLSLFGSSLPIRHSRD